MKMAEKKISTKTKTNTKTVKKAVEVKAKKVVETLSKIAPKQEFKVFARGIAEAPLKLRLVADMVRGKSVVRALNELEFLNKKGALFVKKAIESGAANAKDLASVDKKDLYIKSISVDEGVSLKRFKIASRSRVANIAKRRSHINLVLSVK